MRHILDGVRAVDMEVGFGGASACNDAAAVSDSRSGDVTNNTSFVTRDLPSRLLLRADAEEILCSYGREYWRNCRAPSEERCS